MPRTLCKIKKKKFSKVSDTNFVIETGFGIGKEGANAPSQTRVADADDEKTRSS